MFQIKETVVLINLCKLVLNFKFITNLFILLIFYDELFCKITVLIFIITENKINILLWDC